MLTLMEQINIEFLHQYQAFYTLSRDVTNFLTVINSSATFLIYMIFGKEFRKEMLRTWRPLLPLIRSSSGWKRPISLELQSSSSIKNNEDSALIENSNSVVISSGMLTVNGRPLKNLLHINAQENDDNQIPYSANYGSHGKTQTATTVEAHKHNGYTVHVYKLEPYGVRV